MGKLINLDNYRREKEDSNEKVFRETTEEFLEISDYEGDLELGSFDEYTIYNDEFIEQNAEHIAHHTLPFCTVCGSPLREGDKVDNMWPLEYGHNICQSCEHIMGDSIKNESIVNIDKLKLILIEKDFNKILNHLSKGDIHNINGNKIISEELYLFIKYQILHDN